MLEKVSSHDRGRSGRGLTESRSFAACPDRQTGGTMFADSGVTKVAQDISRLEAIN